MDTIKIAEQELLVKELHGKRVVTFREIDEVHQREAGTAKRNFHENRQYFIEGRDFLVMSIGKFREKFAPNSKRFGNPNFTMLLLTESGYLMLVKSFTDDLAWRVQRELVNNYFKTPAPVPALPPSVLAPVPQALPEMPGKRGLTAEDLRRRRAVIDPVKKRAAIVSALADSLDTGMNETLLCEMVGTLSHFNNLLGFSIDRAKSI